MRNKKMLFIIIVLTILLLICAVLLIITNKYKNNEATVPYEEENAIILESNNKLEEVINRNNYYTVENAINKFYIYYAELNQQQNYKIIDDETKASIEKQEKASAENLYKILDKDYIKYKDITTENIRTKLPVINNSIVNITNMYVSEQSLDIYIYIAKGTLREKISNNISNFSIMVKLDTKNRTYSIFLEDYIQEKYPNIEVGEILNINKENIEKNENNAYEYVNVTEEMYVENLFNKFKEELLYNMPLAYQRLDEEYKAKRFNSEEEFQNYEKNNTKNNVIMEVRQYQRDSKEGYTQYICIDQNNNEYVFKVTSVINYKILLDTYTIELPEAMETYNNLTDQEKIKTNLNKIFKAINEKNYKYVYEKLDNTFKNNYYPTEDTLKTYLEQTIYTNNKVEYTIKDKNKDLYICNVNIKDKENTKNKTINMKVIIQLKEGTDFVISFSEI